MHLESNVNVYYHNRSHNKLCGIWLGLGSDFLIFFYFSQVKNCNKECNSIVTSVLSREVVRGMSNKNYTFHPQLSTMTHFEGLIMCSRPSKPTFLELSGNCGN